MDAIVENHGSVYLIRPSNSDAMVWLESHTSNDAMWWAGALVVDHRYVNDIINGMISDGLVVH